MSALALQRASVSRPCRGHHFSGQEGAAGTATTDGSDRHVMLRSVGSRFRFPRGVSRQRGAKAAPEAARATGPQPQAKQERTSGWQPGWRMGSRFALGRTPRAVRCKGAGAPGLGLRGRGGRAGGAFKPCCCTALHPPPSISPPPSGNSQQDAVLLGSGRPVPPRLLQGQLVSGAGEGSAPAPQLC